MWPNYVHDHSFMFENGDVNGQLDRKVCAETDIHGMPKEAEENMAQCLSWAVGVLEDVIKKS